MSQLNTQMGRGKWIYIFKNGNQIPTFLKIKKITFPCLKLNGADTPVWEQVP